MGIPTVTFIGDSFEVLATSIARTLGMPALPYIPTPHPIVRMSDEEIVDVATDKFDDVVRSITAKPEV